MEIKDQIIIVTGASQGIGLATAKYLSKLGARVVLAARSTEIISNLEKEIPGSIAIATDMRKTEDIKNLVKKTMEKFGRIDILINNAGQGLHGPLETVKKEDFKTVMELNVFSCLEAMQAVIPVMRSQGKGMIINVSSGLSKMFIPGTGAYSSTKYALNAISYVARKELAKDRIIVSVIMPKIVMPTNFTKNMVGERPEFLRNLEKKEDNKNGNSQVSGDNNSIKPQAERQIPPVQTPEFVAEKIAELIRTEQEEMVL